MASLDQRLDEMERLLYEVEALGEPLRSRVLSLLDGVDALHRHALERLGALLDGEQIAGLRAGDPAVAWLFDAYSVGVDERAVAEAALERVRPYIHSHGGRVELLGIDAGVVRIRLAGSCSGCTASSVTLRHGVEEALREGFPGFAKMEVEEDDALPHAPPGPTLLQIESSLPAAGDR